MTQTNLVCLSTRFTLLDDLLTRGMLIPLSTVMCSGVRTINQHVSGFIAYWRAGSIQVDRKRRCDARRTETCIIPNMTSKFGLLAQMLVLIIFTNDESAVMSRKVKAFNVGRIMGFRGKNFREGVGGKVYVVDENRQNTLLIKNFFFDGGHPVCCWTSPLKFIHLSLLSSQCPNQI